MFCKTCGKEINDAAVICPNCGVPTQGVPAQKENVPNHMTGAILSTLFCCLVGGIVAIVNASEVNKKLAKGDIAGAKESSEKAKTWITISVVVGILIGGGKLLLTLANVQ